MKLSYNWLSEYVDLSDISPHELARLLTLKTCEVEGTEPFLPYLKNYPVAEVKEVKQHPNADKLVICQVNDGENTHQVVTGAPNVAQGEKYPFAPVGTTLPNEVTIKKTKLRGEESAGMLCSAAELLLTEFDFGVDPEAGLLPLPNAQVGHSTASAVELEDTIIEIDNKSITHRPDLWGHFGFARELAAVLNRSLHRDLFQDFSTPPALEASTNQGPSIAINDNAAIAYGGLVLERVEINKSPIWLQGRLIALGMRPINNVVDISNYVMLEIGLPNHAFDYQLLKNSIKVSYSQNDEKLNTLDGETRDLPSSLVLIRDGDKPIALGGVMGGAETEVSETTNTLFLEVACFHRADMRRAVSRLSLRTEASARFEKGQDSSLMKPAAHRFAHLLSRTVTELKINTFEAVETEKPRENKIKTSYSYVLARLGEIELPKTELESYLAKLGIKITWADDSDHFTAFVPTYRSYHDITIPEDLVEEIGRLKGYAECTPAPLKMSVEVPEKRNKVRELEHQLRRICSLELGFTEAYNYPFHAEDELKLDERVNQPSENLDAVELANPIQKDMRYLRRSLLPGLLRNVANHAKEHKDLRFFEIERIFEPTESAKQTPNGLPEEKELLAGIVTSSCAAEDTLRMLSSALAELICRLGINYNRLEFTRSQNPNLHPGRGGIIAVDGQEIVLWGQLHPQIAAEYKLETPTFYFETALADLLKLQEVQSNYVPLPRYPGSWFEVTVLMDDYDEFESLMKVIGKATNLPDDLEKTYIERIDYITTYAGSPIPAGQKAVSLRLLWRNRSRTLKTKELNKLQDELIDRLDKAGYPLRT